MRRGPSRRSARLSARPATEWAVVATLVGAGMVAAAQIGKAPSALPLLRESLGLSLAQSAWVVSIFNILGVVSGMACGALGDRLGHRRMVLGGMTAMSAASFLGAASDGFASLLASRVLEGFGFMLTVSSAPALLVRFSAARDVRLVFGAWGGYWPAGVALMVLVTPPVLAAGGWRLLWALNGVLTLVCVAGLAWMTRAAARPVPGAAPLPFAESMHRTLSVAGPLALALTFAAYSTVHVSFVALMPSFYVELGIGIGIASLLTALIAAVNVAGNFTGGYALHRGVPRHLLVSGAFLVVAALAVASYDGGLPFALRFAAAIALSAVAGIIPASLLAGAVVHAPSAALVGATTGLIMQGSQLGQFVGPSTSAYLVEVTGSWHSVAVALIVAAAIGVGLALWLGRIERARFEATGRKEAGG